MREEGEGGYSRTGDVKAVRGEEGGEEAIVEDTLGEAGRGVTYFIHLIVFYHKCYPLSPHYLPLLLSSLFFLLFGTRTYLEVWSS